MNIYFVGPKTISSRPTWQRVEACLQSSFDSEDEVEDSEAGCAILGLIYTTRAKHTPKSETPLPFLLRRDNSLLGLVMYLKHSICHNSF